MSRETWVAAGVVAVVGWFALAGRRRRPMTSTRVAQNVAGLQGLHPEARSAVIALLGRMINQGREPSITSGRRTCAEQRRLYAQGRTAPGTIVTGANGCSSWHVLGRAVDLDAPNTPREAWEKLGQWWTAQGGVWGGSFANLDDYKHFEWHPGLRIADLCPDPSRCEELVVT